MNSSDRPVSSLLAARILEDAELIGEMLTLTPEGRGDWQPDWPPSIAGEPPFPMAQLSAHLAESLAGVCACLHRLYPVELAHFDKLGQSAASFSTLHQAARAGFDLLADADLTRPLPTVFSPEGAPFLETLLINWKHLLQHGHQLFLYLKLMGVPVGTRHLYRFR